MASQALERQSAYQEIGALLNKGVGQLAAALPRMGQASAELHLARAQRAVRVALSQLRGNQRLLSCTQDSIVGSVVAACQLGLELDPSLGQAYLVSYKQICQMQIGYRGLVQLAARAGIMLRGFVVYEGDEFEYERGTSPFIRHKPIMADRGGLIATYATARPIDGDNGFSEFEVFTLDDIERVKNRSAAVQRGRKDSPWFTDFEQMARKSPMRALAKDLPMAVNSEAAQLLSKAAAHDEYVDAGHAPPQPKLEDFPEAIDVGEDVADGQ